MPRLTRVLTVAAFACLAACKAAPVLNFDNEPIGGQHTADEVRATIASVAKERGWVVEDASPGVLKATLESRSHRAVVNIPYTATAFGIHYVDSTNLDYKGGTIHKNYNKWVNNLRADIQHELAGIPTGHTKATATPNPL